MLFASPHPPMLVPRSRTLVIGRSDECDLPVPSKRASRKHAEVRYEGEQVVIEDLGSTNGTYVNGQRVTEVRVLIPGDVIDIGGVQIDFCRIDERIKIKAPARADATIVVDKDILVDGQQEVFRGDVSEIPVSSVLQMLAMGRKTGALGIISERGSARIWLEEGIVVHAETPTAEGFTAAVHVCHLGRGRFLFEVGLRPTSPTLEMPVETLLIEASRQYDENTTPGITGVKR